MNAQKEQILAQIKEILVDIFELDEEAIVPEAKLYEDLDIDSIDAVDLLIDLKKKIDVDISAEQFNQVRTIQDVVDAFAELSSDAEQPVDSQLNEK
ncbi:acyl carrier protein [Glaciecola siphonariae]|uniref:Acyl carrier protein n=1 Tax=Glaciecola siphonariae TaxID=521012 RepID=A0ABV9LWZ3_9ALTE